MANHPYNQHREQQVAHRRVSTILSGSPAGAEKHNEGSAFSKITSKSAAVRDDDVRGHSAPKRFARGGKVHKGKGDTNIAIVLPGGGAGKPPMPMGGPPGLPPGGPPMPPPPMGGPPGMPPGGPPPGMPMRASGGRIKKEGGGATHVPGDTVQTQNGRAMNKFGERGEKLIRSIPNGPSVADSIAERSGRASGGRIAGEDRPGNNKKWANRAKDNSYFRGGAATGVGREEKAAIAKRK